MGFTGEQIEIINNLPHGLTPYAQILWLQDRGIDFTLGGWGTPTEDQQMAINTGPIASLTRQKYEGGLVQR